MLSRRLAYSLIFLILPLCLFAQKNEQKDSLVRLLGCNELQQVEERGISFRKALGNARFEHNSTMLLCDTALWNVNQNVINAFGHVRIIQNNTVLSSDCLDYLIDQNLAQFRGTLVQLQDKDKNTLRTRDLDYNTKDSVAVFRNGGALRDKDGQVIESWQGTYDSKITTFSFERNVNMYTDSVFVKTGSLTYNTSTGIAVFGTGTNAWRDANMLSSEAGTYDRGAEVFTFTDNVHLLTSAQEAWSDTLVYYRTPNNVEMFGHVELLDTTRNAAAVAGYVQYIDSSSFIRMTRDPAIILFTEQDARKDTAYVGADTLIFRAIPRYAVDSSEIVSSEARVQELNADAVTAYRRKAAQDAAAAAESARKKMEEEDPNAAKAKDRGGAGTGEPAGASASGKASGKASAGGGNPPAAAKPVGTARTLDKNIGKSKAPILPAPWDDSPEMEAPGWRFHPQLPDTVKTARRQDTAKVLAGQDTTKALAKSDTLKTGIRQRDTTVAAAQVPDSLTSGQKILSSGVPVPQPDSLLNMPADSIGVAADSIATADSLANVPKDSTKISFLYGLKNVKVFRSDMQVVCDSLAYNDLDSLIRLYRQPVVWNEIKRQYTADSITVIVRNRAIERASLMSNAFIIVNEDSLCFDQIRGAEMMAYFDSTGALKRFDSMGGASGLFYIEENGTLATVNKFEAKMLTATLANGNIQDLNYFDTVKSDAYPVVQLKKDEKILKGFEWQPDKRPQGPEDVTPYKPRESERQKYEQVPQADFRQTEIYFPGYMDSVHKMLARQDSLKRVRRAERRRLEEARKIEEARIADSLKLAAVTDSLAAVQDSLALKAAADSLSAARADSLAAANALSQKDSLAVADSLASARADSLANDPKHVREHERAQKKAAREQARKDRAAAKEARWAELDARDAAKAKVKEEKALEKKRKATLKTLKARDKRLEKEQRMIDRYKARYEKRKARADRRKR